MKTFFIPGYLRPVYIDKSIHSGNFQVFDAEYKTELFPGRKTKKLCLEYAAVCVQRVQAALKLKNTSMEVEIQKRIKMTQSERRSEFEKMEFHKK